MKTLEQLQFDNSFSRLPEVFYSSVKPQALSGQHLISFNSTAAKLIELDSEQQHRNDFSDVISGKKPLKGYCPVSMCYSGHQFGHYVPQLGDGRAMLLGEVTTSKGEQWDLQIKGSGPTPYSRNADGRAVLRSTIREYLCGEAMHGLGIPSTRALCMIGSNHEVYRETIETGAMLLRMSPSHVRFGSFEFLYYTNRFEELKILADYVIEKHFPQFQQEKNPYLELLKHNIKTTAQLIAKWQAVGFSHGVMNTDNMSILGLTLDYGPFGFIEQYQPEFICNHSDHHGRYAFNKQPEIGLFNLSCLAQALLPLIGEEPELAAEKAKEELKQYQYIYMNHYSKLMREKMGLYEMHKDDQNLCNELLSLMQASHVDYTLLFRRLSLPVNNQYNETIRDLFIDRSGCDQWLEKYYARINAENISIAERSQRMMQVNPKYIFRNYMAEIAIRKAVDDQDYSEIDNLLKLLQAPFKDHAKFNHYAGHPPEWAQQIEVSCSS